MIAVGIVLVSGGARLAGGDLGTPPEPVAGLALSLVGIAIAMTSYFLARRLPGEIAYRTALYLVLVWSSVSLVAGLATLVRVGIPRFNPESGFVVFQLALGVAGIVSLAIFYRLAGVEKLPRSPAAPSDDSRR